MKRGLSGLLLIFVIALFVLIIVISITRISMTGFAVKSSAECSDHIDNDGDGYCDASAKDGYCIDGSKLGDPKCKNKQDSETPSNIIISQEELCDGKSLDSQDCGSDVGACSFGT